MAERPDVEEWMAERTTTMPRVLVLVREGPHAHDYGVDYLLDGLRELCGPERVWEWPEKDSLHLAPGEPRDECAIECDAWWPRHDRSIEQCLAEADVVLIAHSLDHPELSQRTAQLCQRVPARVPIAAVDMTDHVRDLGTYYAQLAGRPLAGYFKRELPLGASWAIPCPLTYPAHKARPSITKRPRVFYHATAHDWAGPGLPRMQIVETLTQAVPVAWQRDVLLTETQRERLSPEAYHARMAECLIGISWNGAPNWDSNRFWENFAFGLAQVAERPRIQLPHPPEDWRHVIYVDEPAAVAPVVRALLADLPRALSIAAEGLAHFRAYHCARARAAWVLRHLGWPR